MAVFATQMALVDGDAQAASTKKIKEPSKAFEEPGIIQAHPLGVKPSGNAFTAIQDARTSLGHFSRLPDETLIFVLEWLDARSLLLLGATCRQLFAFCSTDSLWKDLFVLDTPDHFEWRGSWRSTYCNFDGLARIDCSFVFSDVLHRPYFCSHVPLTPYASMIPRHNQIPRLPDLTPEEFASSWSTRPFILTEPVKSWPVYQEWCQGTLLERYGDMEFRAEAVDWPLTTYVQYMNDSSDESPLYLFDRGFVEKMGLEVGQKSGAYWPPECFGEDFFTLLGDQRPDHRWLILGPERSGSTFHKDPNATSAWNAVIRGSKYWIMFPTDSGAPPPPGVFVSNDEGEVTSPLSIAEWLLTFHEEAQSTPGCVEGVCGEGEILHVPSSWWHLVVNLQPAIAITQNFVPRSHLTTAIDFLRTKPAQVSGFKKDIGDPHALFVERLRESHLELLSVKSETGRKRKWEGLVAEDEAQVGKAFSFGFGGNESDEEALGNLTSIESQ